MGSARGGLAPSVGAGEAITRAEAATECGSNPIARSKEDVKRRSSFVKREELRKMTAGSTCLHFDDSRMTNDERWAHVAQLVEHVLGKDEVTRSIRVVGSMQS